MNNLQSEVMELEFNEFARGKWRITELEFAEMLLRYTGAYDQAWTLFFTLAVFQEVRWKSQREMNFSFLFRSHR